MKTKKDIVDHVSQATGLARQEVGKVIDAAFAFVRESALAGSDVGHPSLGRIRVKVRAAEGGESKTAYRYQPNAEIKAKRARAKPAGEAPEQG